MEISNLPDKGFKAAVIKVLTILGRIEEHRDNFKGLENIKITNQTLRIK